MRPFVLCEKPVFQAALAYHCVQKEDFERAAQVFVNHFSGPRMPPVSLVFHRVAFG